MVQTVLTDGGQLCKQPVAHYREHKETYDSIRETLETFRRAYIEASPRTRYRLCKDASAYATITANIPLEMADRAFEIYVDHYPAVEKDALATDFADNGVGMWDYKSDYVTGIVDSDETVRHADELLRSAMWVEAQDTFMDLPGLGPAKSAFAPAMLGFTHFACADTHVAQYYDVDQRSYDKYDATEYQQMIDDIFGNMRDETGLSNFILQWISFDLHREQIEEHSPWFKHVARVLGRDIA